MRRIASIIVAVLLALCFVQAANAQTGWVVVIYNQLDDDPIEGELIPITESGVLDPIPVPEAVFQPIIDSDSDYLLGRIGITPDLRYLVVTYANNSSDPLPSLPVTIFDLENDSQHTVEMDAEFPLVYNYVISPDGSQIAIAYVGGESDSAIVEDQEISAGLMVADVATGEIVAEVDMDTVREGLDADEAIAWTPPSTWVEGEGVPFVPSCFFCQEIDLTHIWTWNPSDNSFTETEQYFFPFGTVLPGSGEVLIADLDRDFPIGNPDPNAYLPESNVIKYFPPGVAPDEEPTVVFFDDDRFPIGGSPWVYDGRAFLTRQQGAPDSVLVFRDGSVAEFELPAGPVVVVGTPDGAIILDFIGKVYDYRVTGGEVLGAEVAELEYSDTYNLGSVIVLYSTPMGAGAGGKEFPPVAAPGSDI